MVNEAGEAVEPGLMGEIVAEGANVTLARVDEEGFVKCRGEKISCRQIEEV